MQEQSKPKPLSLKELMNSFVCFFILIQKNTNAKYFFFYRKRGE